MGANLRINSILLPLLTLALAVAQIVDPSPVWKALLVGLGGAWLISYLWARSLRNGLRLERAMRFGWVQVGDKLEEQFTLINDGVFPATWVEITDQSTLPGYHISRATGASAKSRNSWHTAGLCSRRGMYQLGGTTMCSGDPLGVYSLEISQSEATTLMVMPPVVPLPAIGVTPGGWLGEGQPRANAPEQTVSSATVRQYVPGDSLRLVHWPTTARRQQPYIRLLEGAPAGDWWIALDFDARVQAGDDEWESTTELGVILAASLADRGLRARRSVGLLANGERPIWMRPQSGESCRWEILRALALLNPGQTTLAHLLESASPALGHQASLIVITPSTESDWLKPLAQFFWRGITPTVILMEPASFGAPGNIQALDQILMEMGLPHHVVTRELLDQPEVRPGWRGQWEWRIMPTGKAIAHRSPGDMTWKRLS